MVKKDLYVKISGRWYQVTSADGIDLISGEEFHLFIDDLEDAKVINEGEAVKEPTAQQVVDYNTIRIEIAKAYIQAYGEQTFDHSSKSFAEKAFNFANEFVKKLIENPINP